MPISVIEKIRASGMLPNRPDDPSIEHLDDVVKSYVRKVIVTVMHSKALMEMCPEVRDKMSFIHHI